ncbi:mid1-interacting protein 1A-like [Amphiura filiformis]|uniref:mid1-interacting protein 1A-like n=1 Tax=Amphiura filiformis TaxID=82378 RepID=UPI003B20E208
MKNFIDAVNDMDETVLIPSRLMDMQSDSTTPSPVSREDQTTEDLPLVPSSTSQEQQPSLHAYYSMLKAVKTELVRGPSSDDEDDEGLFMDSGSEDGTTDENNSFPKSDQKLEKATAKAFREHLHGLFTVLEQLTDMSKTLTTKYQEELGDNQSCIRPKAFSM